LNDFSFRSNNSSAPVTKNNSRSVTFTLGRNMVVQITATPTNSSCVRSGTYAFSSQGFSSASTYATTPNPAASEMTVTRNSLEGENSQYSSQSMASQSQPALAKEPFEAMLYDVFGRLVQVKTSVNDKVKFNVQGLPAGPYLIRVGQGKDAYSEHVQIAP
jgi:hypothetical protein